MCWKLEIGKYVRQEVLETGDCRKAKTLKDFLRYRLASLEYQREDPMVRDWSQFKSSVVALCMMIVSCRVW